MKLSTKVPMFFLMVGVLMLSAVITVSWKSNHILQLSMKGEIIEREAKQLMHLIDRNLFERYHDVSAFSMSLGPIDQASMDALLGARVYTDKLNAFVRNYKLYRRVVLFDLDGNVVAASDENSYRKRLVPLALLPQDVRQRDWFQRTVRGESLDPQLPQGPFVVGPERNLLEQSDTHFDMIFAMLLRDTDGNKLGVWVNVVDFTLVEAIVAESYKLLASRGFDRAELTLLDKQGRVIVDMDPVGRRKAEYQRDFSILNTLNLVDEDFEAARFAVSGLSGSHIAADVHEQTQQVMGYAHSSGVYDYPGLGWSTLVRIPDDAGFLQTKVLTDSTLYLAVTVLIMSILLAFYLSHRMVAPLERVAHSIKQLAQGKKIQPIDYAHRDDEIAEILASLDNLNKIVAEHERLSSLSDEQQFHLDIQRRAIESTATGIVVSDWRQPGKPVIYVNRAFEDLTGYKAEEALGRNCGFLQGDLKDDPEVKKMEYALRNQLSCSVVLRNFKRDGSLFYNSLHLDPVFNENGDLTHYIGVQNDVTELVRAEADAKSKLEQEIAKRTQQYRDSESRLRAVFDTSIDGSVVMDESGVIVEVNRSLEIIFGRVREELLGEKFSALLAIDNARYQEDFVEKNLLPRAGMKTFMTPQKVLGLHKSGREFPMEIAIGQTVLGGEKSFVGVVRDIEERQATKAREIELLQGMKLASDAGGVCNWSLDPATKQLTWDSGMYELYGVPKDHALTYDDWLETICPDDRERVETAVQRALNDNDVFNEEFRIQRGHWGEMRWVKGAGNIRYNQHGEKDTLFGINLDITKERALQEKLAQESQAALQASEAKSRFLATMSHEIRTPMNGVIGMVDLLRQSPLNADQARMTATIRDASFSLLGIINEVLDFSKIESGQMALEYQDADLLEVIEKTLDSIWVTAHNKNLTLLINHDCRLPKTVRIDTVRTRQVILNLLGNAVKFSGGKETPDYIWVTTHYRQACGQVTITVSDTGVGMSQSQLERLFQPFTQADSSTTRKFGGTGLGLSISKSFVEMMGGRIDVETELDRGSEFTVTLPIDANQTRESYLDELDVRDYHIVMLVDDNALCDVCERLLEQYQPASLLRSIPADADAQQTIVIIENDSNHLPLTGFRTLVLDPKGLAFSGAISSYQYSLGVRPFRPSELLRAISVLIAGPSVDAESGKLLPSVPVLPWTDNVPSQSEVAILCVEDQPINRMVLERQLTHLGYRFEMVEDGRQALDKWVSQGFDLLLTDCHMPEMDGFELTAEIRRREQTLGLPRAMIIAITANAMVGESDKCLQAGMDDYIAKPVELERLGDVLAKNVAKVNAVALSTATDETAHSSASLIDLNHLEKIIGTQDPSLVNTVLDVFWHALASDIGLLQEAVSHGQTEKIRQVAHSLKGAAASSGVLSLSRLFRQIEKGSNNPELVEAAMAEVSVVMAALERELMEQDIIGNGPVSLG